jgi:hypothetical protein
MHATAIIDTGMSDHYFTPATPLHHIDSTMPPTTICTATGKTKTSTAAARSCTGYLIPGYTNNLLSIGTLWGNDCTAALDKHQLIVQVKEGNTILNSLCKNQEHSFGVESVFHG